MPKSMIYQNETQVYNCAFLLFYGKALQRYSIIEEKMSQVAE